MAWTAEKADEAIGAIIHKSDKFVIRMKEDDKGLHVYAHRIGENGNESVPLAYMLGYNALSYEHPSKK